MGRSKSQKYRRSLHQQMHARLVEMQAFGESKAAAKRDGTTQDKIYSYNTYKTYRREIQHFVRWLQKTYPNCTTLRAAQRHAAEWLEFCEAQGYSAWSLHTKKAALTKIFGKPCQYTPPRRERAVITRSRGEVSRDRHFSESNNAELIAFCRSTGLRRSELQALKGQDLRTKEQIENEISQIEAIPEEQRTTEQTKRLDMLLDTRLFKEQYFIYVRNGKGGRQRLSPIVGRHALQAVERMQNTPPEEKVWWHVSSHADIHHYRAEYCVRVYKSHARDLRTIPYDRVSKTGKRYKSGVYYCRKDERHRVLDREAMLRASKALGHNRISVVADNYLYAL